MRDDTTGRSGFRGYSPTVHTATSIKILAPRDLVFATISDLAHWPEMLKHYRSVQFLGKEDGPRELVRMQASRTGVPVSWTAAWEIDPQSMELRFEHVRGWSKGMRAIWTLTPTRDGTRLEIVCDLTFAIPGLGWLFEPIIGGFFVDHLANKTLRTLKKVIEEKAREEEQHASKETSA